MLMHQKEHRGEFWVFFGLFYCFSFILGLSHSNGFLLFVPRFHLSLGLAGTNDINWVFVLYFPDQGDLNCVFSG
jgi:hypothetical protein